MLPTRASSRVARLLGIKADPFRQIAFQFDELSPATKGTGPHLRGQTVCRRSGERGSNSGTHYRDCDRGGVPKAVIRLVALRRDGCTARPLWKRQLCSGEEVIVVGGGNSAGSQAVFPLSRPTAFFNKSRVLLEKDAP